MNVYFSFFSLDYRNILIDEQTMYSRLENIPYLRGKSWEI